MKDFFKDHPLVAGLVTVLTVWSVTGTVRHIADVASGTNKKSEQSDKPKETP